MFPVTPSVAPVKVPVLHVRLVPAPALMQPPVPPPVGGSHMILVVVTVTPPFGLQLASFNDPTTEADMVDVRKLAAANTASSNVLLLAILLNIS